jgi:hypothetical protein
MGSNRNIQEEGVKKIQFSISGTTKNWLTGEETFETRERTGWLHDSGLFAVHRTLDKWGITHLKTGYSCGVITLKRYAALEACDYLAKVKGWDKIYIRKNKPVFPKGFRDKVKKQIDKFWRKS